MKGRKVQKKSTLPLPPHDRPVLWIHASSLGEFEQGIPIIRQMKKEKPEYFILITFFSPSGYKIQKNFSEADCVLYLPKDTVSEMSSFLDHFKPQMLVLVKYDFWPVMINETTKRGIQIYLVSAVFRTSQLFFQWYGKWYLSLLKSFTHIFVQDDESKSLLESQGIDNVSIAGDTRIDRVLELKKGNSEIPGIENFVGGSKIIVAGSSWQSEEKFLRNYIDEDNFGDIKIILAPHDVSLPHLGAIETQFGSSLIRYSQILSDPEKHNKQSVLLIDQIGLLSRLYRYADIAIVGGAFGSGLHNILEPAVFGLPIIFGPKYHKFIEASELIKTGAAFSVNSYPEFHDILNSIFSDQKHLFNASKACRAFVDNHKGATKLITSHLLENA